MYAHPLRRAEAAKLADLFAAPLRVQTIAFAEHGVPPAELRDIADQFRGETVLVLPSGGAAGHRLVRLDADGPVVSHWA